MALCWKSTLCAIIGSILLYYKCEGCVVGSYKCDPTDPTRYYQCDHSGWNPFVCGANTIWSDLALVCIHDDGSTTCSGTDDQTTTTSDEPTTTTTTSGTTTTTTTPTDVTSQALVHSTVCTCCLNTNYLNLTENELQEILQELKQELAVNKTTLSSTIRKKTCADDYRVSSQIMGYTASLVISAVVLVIVVSDMSMFVNFILLCIYVPRHQPHNMK